MRKPTTILGIIAILIVHTAIASAADCDCKVTNNSGDPNKACSLPNIVTKSDCSPILFSSPFDNTKSIDLKSDFELKNRALDGSGFTVSINAVSISTEMLIQLVGSATLKNLNVTAPGKIAIQTLGDNSTLNKVTVFDSKVGVESRGTNLAISGSAILDNDTGILLSSSGSDSFIASSTIQGNAVGVYFGANSTGNTILSSTINDNDTGVLVKGQEGFVKQSVFYGNSQKGISLESGANGGITPPKVIAVIYDTDDFDANKNGTGKFSIVIEASAATTAVDVFVAELADSAQGKWFWGSVNGNPYIDKNIFVLEMEDKSLDRNVTLTARGAAGTSEFSIPVNLKTAVKGLPSVDPFTCDSTGWFMKSVENDTDPWSADFDGDGLSNIEEDKNQDCSIDSGETDPADDLSPAPPKDPAVDLTPVPCGGTPDPCKPDFDGDGVPDYSDNCPNVYNKPPDGLVKQTDTDGDKLGDVCDPDMDNDGLSNEYCDGAACGLGADQEGAAGTDPLNPDSDGDGYCDGPGFGPVVNGKPTVCTQGPGDNCPREDNNQWDADEDGIGNECDGSKFDAFTSNPDSDGDGVKDFQINGEGDNCAWLANTDQADTDFDGRGDACDSDDDNDGVLDVVENSTRYTIFSTITGTTMWIMLDPTRSQSDVAIDSQDVVTLEPDFYCDGQGQGLIGDEPQSCPHMPDADGCPILNISHQVGCIPDVGQAIPFKVSLNDFASDDCPAVKNLGIKGANGKDIACTPDMDGDGVPNWVEEAQRTHYWEADSDHYMEPFNEAKGFKFDGYNDKDDNCPANYNPGSPQPDVCKKTPSTIHSDSDGIPDLQDNCPTVANADQSDMDSDGQGDVCDSDTDGDGIANDADNCDKFNDPTNTCTGATPGESPEPPPTPGPKLTLADQSIQGGAGCSLIRQ